MNIAMIAAIGKNRELGKNNDLIWHFKEDGTVFHPHSGLCLSAFRTQEGGPDVQMRTCNALDKNQIWKFET